MAKRSRKLNPAAAEDLGREIDDIVNGSGTTIDAVYEEYKEVDREIAQLEDIKTNLQENDQTVPVKLRTRIAENKVRRRELDRRIAQYGRIMLRRIKERMDVIRASPGASFNRDEIRRVDRAIFKVKQKAKNRGADIRSDLSSIMGAVVTLEQDSGIVIRRPGRAVDEESRRKAQEAELYAALVDQWKKVYRHAKKDKRVKEDVEWVTAQLRGLDVKFRRGESIRRGIERVARRIKDIHNRTKPRKVLWTYAEAQQGISDFAAVIEDYSRERVTAAGVDRLKTELETFSRQFTPAAKSKWTKTDQRKFATDVRKLHRAIDALRPGKKRKKNPSRYAVEKPTLRVGNEVGTFTIEAKRPKMVALSRGDERIVVASADQSLRYKGKEWDYVYVYSNKGYAGQMFEAPLESQSLAEATQDAVDKIEGTYYEKHWLANPRGKRRHKNPCIGLHFHGKDADELMKAIEKSAERQEKKNPKKSTRKKVSPAQRLIKRCQKLWDTYCERPTKKNLRAVLEHLEKMKQSKSEKVKSERRRCLRVANKEAKRLKVK